MIKDKKKKIGWRPKFGDIFWRQAGNKSWRHTAISQGKVLKETGPKWNHFCKAHVTKPRLNT